MVDSDLPDPEEIRITSPKQLEGRFFKILYSLTVFAVLYSSVHKIWIPLFLKFTDVNQAAYKEIDFWFVPAFFLWWHLHTTKSLGKFGSLLCGALIVHGILDLWMISLGRYFGWLQISHLLSSVPLALISIGWLTMAPDRKPYSVAAWGGVFLGVLLALTLSDELRSFCMGTTPKPEIAVQKLPDSDPGVPQLARSNICGRKAFWLDLKDYPDFNGRTEIMLEDCGFSPAFHRLDSSFGFLVSNQTGKAANIHLLVFQPDGRKRGLNRILRTHEKWELHPGQFDLGDNEYLMIYSDTAADAGVTAMVPNDQTGGLKITRSPLLIAPLNDSHGGPHNEL
jgi:hypothetical protein